MKRTAGFTLIELLVTITIVGILMSVAVPSFKTTIQNGRLVTQANDLLGALIYARSQAIAKNTSINICASSDQSTCSSGGNWAQGWVVCNGSGSTCTTVLRVHPAITTGNTLTNDASAKNLTFTAGTGFVTPTASLPLNFKLCDSRGASYARSIYLSVVGEPRVSTTVGKKIDGTTAIPACP